MVRCLFQLQESTENAWNPKSRTLLFRACYDSNIPGHQRFYEATPTGKIEIQVNNPEALQMFKLGEYYIFNATPQAK